MASKHTTYVLEHPDARYDMIVSCASCTEVVSLLAEKLSQPIHAHLPKYGWTIKTAHRDEHMRDWPYNDDSVQYTDWDWIERNGL